jgi:hypothetical protein
MANKKNKMGESDILARVNGKVKECVGWYDSKLSRERERVLKYINSELPRRQNLGSSSFVSTDVYDSVEAMKAQVLETFSENSGEMVSFDPMGPGDTEGAREATAYCDYVVWRENPGYNIFYDAIHDGLTARAGVVKVFWDENSEDQEETFDGIEEADAYALASKDDVKDFDGTQAPDGTYSGSLTRKLDKSKVTIEPIAPEEFLISPRSRNIHTADICAHRTLKTKPELLARGYDASKVKAIHYDDAKGLDMSPEVLARNNQVETAQALDNPIQPELEKVMLYEAYARMDLKDGKGTRLYRIVYAADTLFEMEEVDRAPFKAFVPLPIPYLFFGNNFAARCVPYQNARTVLTRAILDHTVTTVTPRWTVLKGGLLQPKEMIDNRQGGLVNINRPDAIQPLPQANLNPFVFQTLEMLKGNKEESTGISALSQGLNKDAISTQNSAALVDNLVTLSQQRQKIIARNFAHFLIEVYLEVYRLVLENQDKEKAKIVEVAGQFKPISTRSWVERTSCRASLHLGYGERDREVSKFDALGQRLKELGPMFSPQNQYKFACDAMKKAGFQNFMDYITPPEKVQPPQPDPLKKIEAQAKDKSATAALITAQASAGKNDRLAQIESAKITADEAHKKLEDLLSMKESHRMDIESLNRVDISQREMKLAEDNPPQDKVVVSPNG